MRKGVLDPAGIGRENMVNHLQNKTYLSITMASIIYRNKRFLSEYTTAKDK
jgi:hypothetical protein